MNKFNICRGFSTVISGYKVPMGAFYGKDSRGYWVCIEHEKSTDILRLMRYENNIWIIRREKSDTTAYIKQCADKFGLWGEKIVHVKKWDNSGYFDSNSSMDRNYHDIKTNDVYRKSKPGNAVKYMNKVDANRHGNTGYLQMKEVVNLAAK